jgi:hypothetical protein
MWDEDAGTDAWAAQFDDWISAKAAQWDLKSLVAYEFLAPFASRAVPPHGRHHFERRCSMRFRFKYTLNDLGNFASQEEWDGAVDAESLSEAESIVEDMVYAEYDDQCGIMSREDYMEEEGMTESEADDAYAEERMSCCSYMVEAFE